jgi:C4-dicarboxylate-specific signal transduction histidine kinase
LSDLADVTRYLRLAIRRVAHSWVAGTMALACAMALTLTSAGFVYLSINRIHEAFGWVQQTDRTLQQILNVEKSLMAAGLPSRGRSSGRRDPASVEGRSAAIASQVDRLAWLTSADTGQSARTLALRATLARRAEADLHAKADEFRSFAAARLQLLTMRGAEFERLTGRTEHVERATTQSLILAAVTGLLALLLGSLGIGLLTAERVYRSQIQRDLMHLQRLDTMSLATTALAHEVNQPLTAARNFLAAGMREMTGGVADAATTFGVLKRAQEQVARAGEIVNRLRNFVEKPGANDNRTLERPPAVIDDSIALLGTPGDALRIVTQIEPDLPCVLVDRIQLQQVLLNLIRNAVEALAGKKPCELRLSAAVDGLGAVLFAVSDNGPGLTKRAMGDMFKPFTSTKENGMGVGLAICKGIIEAHGGHIWAASGAQGGTVVSFTLPVVTDILEAA